MHKRIRTLLGASNGTNRRRAILAVAGLLTMMAACLTVAAVMANTESARHWLERRISSHMTGRVTIDGHWLSPSGRSLEISGLKVFSARDELVLGIDRLRFSWNPTALLKRTLKINKLRLDHVSVRLVTEPDGSLKPAGILKKLFLKNTTLPGGGTLLPFPPRILIVESAEISDIDFTRLAAADMNPPSAPLSLSLASIHMQGTLDEKDIRDLRIAVGKPSEGLAVSGEIRGVFTRPELDLSVNGAADLGVFKPLLNAACDFTGPADLRGVIRGVPDNPEIHAEIKCRQPVMGPVVLDELLCRLDGTVQALAVDVRAAVPGPGEITATGNLDLTGFFPDGITALKHNVDHLAYTLQVRAAGADLNRLLVVTPRLNGRVKSDFAITGRGISADRIAADITGRMEITDFRPGGRETTEPLAVEMAGQCRDGIFRLDRLSAQTAGAHMTGNGRYALETKDVSACFRLTAAEISGLAALSGYDRVSGRLEMEADVSGAFPGMTAEAVVRGGNLSIAPVAVGDVDGRLVLSRGLLTVEHLDIRRGDSHGRLQGVVRLIDERTGTATADPVIDLTMTGSGVRLEDVMPDRIKGEATFTGTIRGTIKKPVGEISLEVTAPDVAVARADQMNASATLTGDVVDIRSFEVRFPDGEFLRGSGALSLKERTYRFEAASEALSLHRLRWLHDRVPVDGTATLFISGQGAWGKPPALQGDMRIRHLTIAGKSMENMTCDVRFDNHLIEADLNGDGVVLAGTLNPTDKTFSIRCQAKEAQLAPWLTIIDRPDLNGTITGRLEAAGVMTDIPAMEASAEIDRMALSYQQRDWCRADPFRLDCRDGAIHVPGIKLTVADEGTITISGRLGFDRSVSLDINGNAPFAMAEMMIADAHDMTGRVTLTSRVTGTLDRPGVTGVMKLSDIGLTLPDMSGRLHDISGIVRFQQENITIEEITGLLGTGRFQVTGAASLEGYLPAAMNIRLTAESIPVVVPDKMDLTLDANLALVRDAGQAVVRGEVVLVDGVYFQDAELVNQTDIFPSPFQKKQEPRPDTTSRLPSFLQGLSLDLTLKHRLPLKVDNNIGLLEVLPDLAVKGNVNHPVILGEARIDSGEVLFQRTPFQVEKGAIIFANPYQTEPVVDLTAVTTIRQWKINLKASGTPDRLEIELTSDPREEQGDILSLLVFGRPTRDMTADAGDSEKQAETLATFLAGTMSGDIRKITGLDIVEVSTAESREEEEEEVENQTNDQSRITVGSRVSDRLTLKYSVESGQNGLVQESASDYRLTDTMTVSGFQNNRGVVGGKLVFRYEFR